MFFLTPPLFSRRPRLQIRNLGLTRSIASNNLASIGVSTDATGSHSAHHRRSKWWSSLVAVSCCTPGRLPQSKHIERQHEEHHIPSKQSQPSESAAPHHMQLCVRSPAQPGVTCAACCDIGSRTKWFQTCGLPLWSKPDKPIWLRIACHIRYPSSF